MPPDVVSVQNVQTAIAKQFPSLASQITTLHDTFASDVEEEANSYFQVRGIAGATSWSRSSPPCRQEQFSMDVQ